MLERRRTEPAARRAAPADHHQPDPTGSPLLGPGHCDVGAIHRRHDEHHRLNRDPDHRRRAPRPQPLRLAVLLVLAGIVRHGARGRQAFRPLWTPPLLPRRPVALPHRVGLLGALAEHGRAYRGSRSHRNRGRRHDGARRHHHRRYFFAARTRPLDGTDHGRLRVGQHRGSVNRRLHHRPLRLAVGLPRQSAPRADRAGDDCRFDAEARGSRAGPHRLARHRLAGCRCGADLDRPHLGWDHVSMEFGPGDRRAGDRCRAHRGVRCVGKPRQGAHLDPAPLRKPRLHGRGDPQLPGRCCIVRHAHVSAAVRAGRARL